MTYKANLSLIISILYIAGGCSSFKAQRLSSLEESDKKVLEISDKWSSKDTTLAVNSILEKMRAHSGLRAFITSKGRRPSLFIANVKNDTTEDYFPIEDLNDEFLDRISAMGQFTLIDKTGRDQILKEVQYQHGGMVNPKDIKKIGRQTGADIIIQGNVHMRPKSREGKTIKEYAINLKFTDIEKGIEVARVRTKLFKYSTQASTGW